MNSLIIIVLLICFILLCVIILFINSYLHKDIEVKQRKKHVKNKKLKKLLKKREFTKAGKLYLHNKKIQHVGVRKQYLIGKHLYYYYTSHDKNRLKIIHKLCKF